ncbi:hypothetical protein FisN_14Lu250 [Fistulifera solaris]|uniref:Uncharacterized protein n=1 Tax=Fistulifera solaris TaxID=1519565 RepID=A0A1Z5J9N9_FISSO|nr:hypothetical protein FisN_14Lu250 [Fistulifera solaris]|eukprot:GAX10710.1 hypothetical protein FisN_14Lu250 [Fistulifera solaris]
MSYDIPKSFLSVPDSKLPPELKETFHSLCKEAEDIIKMQDLTEHRESTVARFHRRVVDNFSAHPVLARTVVADHERIRELTLLAMVCFSGSICRETIYFLLQVNPYALLYVLFMNDSLIHVIAVDRRIYDVLLWIVEHYPWVFQHAVCQLKPPHIWLMRDYVYGQCSLETVRKFYELYPQGLRERETSLLMFGPWYPLSLCIDGENDPDANFCIWMAKQFPDAVYHLLTRGFMKYTVLQKVCSSLASTRCTSNMAKICRFLITEHADLIRQQGCFGEPLPIVTLAAHCNRPLVQEAAVLMMKTCPECVKDNAGNWLPSLSPNPFIQQVHPLVVQELEIEREISLLSRISDDISKAAIMTRHQSPRAVIIKSHLLGCLSEVYCSWSNLRISDVLQRQKQQIQEQIAEVCRKLEGNNGFEIMWYDGIREEFEMLDWIAHYDSNTDDENVHFDEMEDRLNEDSESELESEEDEETEDDYDDDSSDEIEGFTYEDAVRTSSIEMGGVRLYYERPLL